MPDASESDATIREFTEAASRLGRYLAASDGDRPEVEFLLRRIEVAYAVLVEQGAQSKIGSLLAHEDPYVRLYAAQVLLLTEEAQAVQALESLQRMPMPPNLAANARLFLTHWKMGVLFPGSWPRP